jgi:hypothetical protein
MGVAVRAGVKVEHPAAVVSCKKIKEAHKRIGSLFCRFKWMTELVLGKRGRALYDVN